MRRNPTFLLLLAIIAAHVGLAALFASATPYRSAGILMTQRGPDGPARVEDVGAPDERQHVNYVARLLRGEGFPVFNPKDPNLYETYQSHQPPGFYLLAAAWSKVMGITVDDLEAQGSPAGLRLRALNIVLGAFTVAGVFFLGFWGFGRKEAALAAAAFAALLPMNLALSGAVSNDPLLFALCTWVLALLAKSIREGWNLKISVAIGILTGIAFLTKTSSLALIPACLIALFVSQAQKPNGKHVASAIVPALLLGVPWWARNQSLYGDPFAITAFGQAFTGSAQASTFIQEIGPFAYWTEWVGWWTARSFVGVFGYMDIWLTNNGLPGGAAGMYQLVLLVVTVSVVGFSLRFTSNGEDEGLDRIGKSLALLNGLFLLVVVLLFLRFNSQYFQAQARYLFSAIGPIACGVGLGLTRLLRQRKGAALAVIVVSLLVVNVFALTRLSSEFSRRTTVPLAYKMGNDPGLVRRLLV